MKKRRKTRVKIAVALLAATGAIFLPAATRLRADASGRTQLSSPFTRQILSTSAEAPLALRFFTTAVKTDSQGRVITGPNSDPVKNIVGPEAAGERGGMQRFTKIMFGADYINGRPDPGTRIDPNNPSVKSGSQLWPNREQPFRSQPRSLALTPDGRKLYVALPGREGYPDWRVSVVDTANRRVTKWIDLRPTGVAAGLRPISVKVSPLNPAIYPRPYAIVLNQYANFASVIDTGTDTVIGDFQTSTYAEKALFNADGTRLYVTDRFKDVVRAFRVSPGPVFTQIAEIPTGTTDLERANPRDLDLSGDGRTLYVANTLGHTIAAINVANDANTLTKNLIVGGLSTDVKIAGRWGIVSGQETNTKLNERETGHGVPTTNANGVAIKNNGQPLGYTPVMTDATKATTFDDIGSELNIFDTATNLFVYRYVDKGRDYSQLVTPGQIVDLHDHADAQKIIRGSGPEQMTIKNGLLFVTMLHSDKVEVFRINQTPSDVSGILTPLGFEFTGGITPEGIDVSTDGRTVYAANLQTEDISFLTVDQNGALTRQGYLAVGVTPSTSDPVKGGKGAGLFATDEEVGLRWFFSSAYADDGPVAGVTPGGFDPQKSCGFCHWDARQDGCQWNVAANAVGGVKVCPQNKDISDNWPEWYEGLNNDFMAYASACNGEVLLGERGPTPLFPQANQADRMHAREDFVLRKTEENSRAIGRPELNGKAFKVGYNDLAYLQILWSQNETRLFPNPLAQIPTDDEAAKVERGRQIFTGNVAQGGAGCADCHHNGNRLANGVPNDTFQDFNIHEPGVISESTVDGKGPFFRPDNDYFFEPFAPPQDVGTPQNFSSRNTKHLRALWDAVPKYLHYGFAHTLREVLLAPDSPLLRPGERGFNFRTVRLDQSRPTAMSFLNGPAVILPTQVPITVADSSGNLAGDGKGQILVSLDSPFASEPDGTLQIDRLGTSNLIPLMSGNQINPALAANNIQVIKDTHGKTSHLSAADLEALILYLKSLDRKTAGAILVSEDVGPGSSPTPTISPSASPTPNPGPSATASPSASPSGTPSASPKTRGGRALNISTRLKVGDGDNAMIGGFIVTGNTPKKLLVRALGPSLSQFNISGALPDPMLELRGGGGALLCANDNWTDDSAAAEAVRQSGVAPQNERESAIVATLAPGSYTAVVSGKSGATGTGLIEIYDLEETADCELANISTRGFVQAGEDVMIGGFVLGGGNESTRVLVRAIGPSLAKFGVTGALSDPMLELHDGNGALLQRNNDWRDQQETEIGQTGVAPRDNAEAAILASLAPGAYTAVVASENGQTGVALVEVFALH
jgi:DNA-binding beta-propeller fold protein YncE